MADLNHVRNCIRSVLTEYAERRANQKDVEAQLVFDVERDRYQLLYMGWDGFKQVFYPIVHLDVRDGKVWIQHNATEEEIADDLMSLGIDRQEIVLGMHHPSLRPYTDFAVV